MPVFRRPSKVHPVVEMHMIMRGAWYQCDNRQRVSGIQDSSGVFQQAEASRPKNQPKMDLNTCSRG